MKFSILIPAYKANHLKECIDSILSQTYKDFEVIIVDDDSPYPLIEVMKEFQDDRLYYYRNITNCGAVNVVDNWNTCLRYAKGDYVICMGDDDLLATDCLEEYVKWLEKYPNVNVFHCRSYIIDDNSNKYLLTPSWPEYESVYENIWHRIFHHREHFIGDYLIKRNVLLDIGGYYKLPLAWGSDDITSYMAMNSSGVVHINKPIFYYRRNGQTISNTGSPKEKLKAVNGEEEWLKSYIEAAMPKDEQTKVIVASIFKEMPHYFKTKRLSIIAYEGLNGNLITRFFYWKKNYELSRLDFKELIYACILNLKFRQHS